MLKEKITNDFIHLLVRQIFCPIYKQSNHLKLRRQNFHWHQPENFIIITYLKFKYFLIDIFCYDPRLEINHLLPVRYHFDHRGRALF